MVGRGRIGRLPSRTSGYAYILLLVLIASLGIASAAAVSLGSSVVRRDAETQLLAVGREFEQALRSYRTASASPAQSAPLELEQLLKDPRSPATKRHLRQIYVDPLTGKPEWGLVKDRAGAILGVYSLADGEPVRQSGFDAEHLRFSNAKRYADWVFSADMPSQAVRSVSR